MAAGGIVAGAFYLDDPSDGVTATLLADVRVALYRDDSTAAGTNAAAAAAMSAAALVAPADADALGAATVAALLQGEHTLEVASALWVARDGGAAGAGGGAGAAVDVRDSGDAWVRIVLYPGDVLVLQPRVHRRLVVPGTPLVTLPAWGADADAASRQSTVRYAAPVPPLARWLPVGVAVAGGVALAGALRPRFVRGSAEEAAANVPHYTKPGNPHTRRLVAELCESFYHLGWVTGTGGSISIRHGDRIFMAPSGVQKERMQPQDIFVLDSRAVPVFAPTPLPGKPRLKLSQCAPLFHHAFTLRHAGACIHTHDINAVMATLQHDTEWRITHQEMIKGIAGHGFLDDCVVPIIENTPHECDLADSLEEAMTRYPRANAVLVRRHGVYVWGASWEAAKTQAECYHYLFDASVRMVTAGLDPGAVPRRVTDGIGAATGYGTDLAGVGGRKRRHGEISGGGGATAADACCGGSGSGSGGAGLTHAAPEAAAARLQDATAAGFHGTAGTSSLAVEATAVAALPLAPAAASHVVLDIEGATTPIAFVTKVLFPFAAAHAAEYVTSHWGSREVADDVAALAAQSAADVAAGLNGATAHAVTAAAAAAAARGDAGDRDAVAAAVVDNMAWQMAADRKTTALKGIQGHIWRAGYASGALTADVFDDVVPALAAWTAAGKRVYIYSSGSREAQRLLFAHTPAGDVRRYLSGYFDTTVGPKVAAASYTSIALSLGVDTPAAVLFVTDSLAEARAAATAGMQVAVTDRPGNLPLPAGHGFPVVTSFAALV